MTGGDLKLKAFVSSTNDYNYYIANPNAFQDYPDVFIDSGEDPCTYTPPTNDIVASISAHTDETTGYTDKRDRRCALAGGWTANNGNQDGTASGYSEFRDGVYSLIAAAGKNRELIRNYSRRKLVGKLMCGGVTSYTFSNSWLNG